MPDSKPTAKPDDPKAGQPAPDQAAKQVQAAMDLDTERGYRGEPVDPIPNEAYTVAGVTAGTD